MSSNPTFWISDATRNEVSLLGLVASDAAYKQSGFAAGAVLQSVPDNERGEDYPFPATLLSRLGEQGIDPSSRLFYQLATSPGRDGAPVRTVEFQNWHFTNLAEDPASGLALVIYERTYDAGNAVRKEYLVAFRGTDGRNGRDWYANIQLGKRSEERRVGKECRSRGSGYH